MIGQEIGAEDGIGDLEFVGEGGETEEAKRQREDKEAKRYN